MSTMHIVLGVLLTCIGFRVTLNYLNGVCKFIHAILLVWFGVFAMGA